MKGEGNGYYKNRERIIALLKNGECSICDKKGFKNIMGHVVRAHGINSTELKDELLLSRNSGFWSEEIKTEYSKRAKEKNYVSIYREILNAINAMKLARKKVNYVQAKPKL